MNRIFFLAGAALLAAGAAQGQTARPLKDYRDYALRRELLLKRLDVAATQSGGWFTERPSDTVRRHVWVAPFWEDDPLEAALMIGTERSRQTERARYKVPRTVMNVPSIRRSPSGKADYRWAKATLAEQVS